MPCAPGVLLQCERLGCFAMASPTGLFKALAGSGAPGWANGTGTAASFAFPRACAMARQVLIAQSAMPSLPAFALLLDVRVAG